MSGIVCHFAKSTDGVCRNPRCAEVCQGRANLTEMREEKETKSNEFEVGVCGTCGTQNVRLVDGMCSKCLRLLIF